LSAAPKTLDGILSVYYLLYLSATDHTVIILASLGKLISAMVLIVIVITVGIVVYKKRNRFVLNIRDMDVVPFIFCD